jgi:aminopeptidase N
MPILHGTQACGCRSAHSDFAQPGADAHYPPNLELQPIHLEIDLHVDLAQEAIAGTVTATVEARTSGPRTLALHAVDFQELDVQDADGRALSSSYDGRKLVVTWSEPFAAAETRRVAIRYRVQRPVTGLFFSLPTAAQPNLPWFAATDHETERARHWLPCVDLPNVRPRLDFKLRAESRFTILANGALIDETAHADGTKTAHYRLDQPCPSYLTCFAIGEFARCDDGEFEGRPVAYFASTQFDASHLARSFGRTRPMLQWLTAKLGAPFPYPKYFQFALPDFGGAMENISLVSWDDVFVLDETLAKEWGPLVDQVNVHEMAHSYFGDWLVCRDFSHAWLKESWATYIESCWLEDKVGSDAAVYDFFANAAAYFSEADEQYKRPLVTRVFDHSWSLYDRHLYPGGACRLHMLRKLLGDEVFWSGVRDYVQTYGGQVVETDDFRRMLEKHSGRSLVRYFEQWFYAKGYPSLKVTFSHDAKTREGTFEIEQTQVDDKTNMPAFALTLKLGWVVDGKLSTRVVEFDRQRHTVIVEMPREPEQVRVDPYTEVLLKLDFNPGDGMLLQQLTRAEDVAGRILAGQELAKTGRAKNIAALRDAYSTEAFWGVRIEWARALSKLGTEAAVQALVHCVEVEHDPLAQEAVLRAAGALRDPRLAQALQARLDAGLPYRASAAALEGLGRQRAQAPLDELLRHSASVSFGGHVQSGALRALAATRRSEALPVLIEQSRVGATPFNARPASVFGLGELGRNLLRGERERARERLVDLLRDPVPRIRQAALMALGNLGDPDALSALTAYRASVSEQEQLGVDRVLRALRSSETPRTAALEKHVDELEGKLRKLDDALQRLEARIEPTSAPTPKLPITGPS